MTRIIIRHLTGTRANQVDEFPISAAKELIVGRDISANVRVDPDRDDLVSRQHLKIACNSGSPDGIQLVDLQSRNGTFVNRQRVYGTVHLNHNDVVQLGAGGPEFRFELDPSPIGAGGARPTREASFDPTWGTKPTREAWSPSPGGFDSPIDARAGFDNPSPVGKTPVGRATVERMLGDVFSRVKTESNRSLHVGVAALVAIIAIGVGGWFYLRQSRTEQIRELERNLAAQQRVAAVLRTKSDQASLQRLVAIQQDIQRQLKTLEDMKSKAGDGKAPVADTQTTATAGSNAKPGTPAPIPASVTAGSAPTVAIDQSYDSLLDQATDKLQHGKLKEALDSANLAIAKDPSRSEAYEFAGQLAERLNDYGAANKMFEEALRRATTTDGRQEIQFKLDALKQKLASR